MGHLMVLGQGGEVVEQSTGGFESHCTEVAPTLQVELPVQYTCWPEEQF